MWYEVRFYPACWQAFRSAFFPKPAKANWPTSNRDHIWYESGTNNKQLQLWQLQFFYRISSWLSLSHNSALRSGELASHGAALWRYGQIKASALAADASFKRLIHRIVYHQRNRYMCQHCFQKISFQTKVIYFPTSNKKKIRIWGMNLICSKAAFHWSDSAKAFNYELRFLHFKSFLSCQNGIKKLLYKYGSNKVTKHPAWVTWFFPNQVIIRIRRS